MVQTRGVNFDEKTPHITVPLTGTTEQELIQQAMAAEVSDAEIVEWRVDFFKSVQEITAVIDLLSHIRTALKNKVLLFTFRTIEEGGNQPYTLSDYQELCLAAADSGLVDMLDIELEKAEFLGRNFIQRIKNRQVIVVMSSHDFTKTPEDAVLILRLGMMNQFGADIGKLAMMPQNLQDVLRTMGIIQKARGFNQLPLAIMSMGELGKITRISGSLTGSVMTFASLDMASAPGQIPVAKMREFLTELAISETIELEKDTFG